MADPLARRSPAAAATDPEVWLAQVEAAARPFEEIGTLLVFGSRARGDHRPDSDLDLAVLLREQPEADPEGEPLRRHRFQQRLVVALAHLAPEGRVDVVLLDEAPDTLRQRVMEDGKILLCREPEAWQALRVRTMKEYGDREWYRRLYRRELRRRLLREAQGTAAD